MQISVTHGHIKYVGGPKQEVVAGIRPTLQESTEVDKKLAAKISKSERPEYRLDPKVT